MHHRTDERRTIREFLFAGRRKYLVTFVSLCLFGCLGLASASWFTLSGTGHGNAYGKGQNTQTGVDLTSLDYSADGTCSTGAAPEPLIGPSQSGFLCIGVKNSNAFAVTLTGITPTSGAKITAVSAPTCTATQGTDFNVSPWAGPSMSIPAGGSVLGGPTANGGLQMAITTTSTFPSCLAGQNFSLAVDIADQAS